MSVSFQADTITELTDLDSKENIVSRCVPSVSVQGSPWSRRSTAKPALASRV